MAITKKPEPPDKDPMEDLTTRARRGGIPALPSVPPPLPPEKKTRADVQRLKDSWVSNPNWKLSETPGFDEYRDELVLFEKEIEKNREGERQKALERSAETLFETAFAQAGGSIGEQDDTIANTFALTSISYSLLGITKQLDYIRMELEKMRSTVV